MDSKKSDIKENNTVLNDKDEIKNDNEILDISKVDPIFILNQYMLSTAGNLLFQDLNKNDANDKKKIKIAIRGLTPNEN